MSRSDTDHLTAALDMPAADAMFNRNMLNVILDRTLASNPKPPQAWPMSGVFVQFVRLVDKALREYDSARADLVRYVDPATPSNETSSNIRAADHMDNCIFSLARAQRLSESLRTAGYGRSVTPLTERQRVRLRDFRNTLEHVDERLLKAAADPQRRIDVGESYAIRFGNNAMAVGKNSLRYDEVVGDLHKLYRTIEAVRGPSTVGAFWNSKTRTDLPPNGPPPGSRSSDYLRDLSRLLTAH